MSAVLDVSDHPSDIAYKAGINQAKISRSEAKAKEVLVTLGLDDEDSFWSGFRNQANKGRRSPVTEQPVIEYVASEEEQEENTKELEAKATKPAKSTKAKSTKPAKTKPAKTAKPVVERKREVKRETKLTAEIVVEARRLHAEEKTTLKELAARYGVAVPTMSHAIYRITWKHLP